MGAASGAIATGYSTVAKAASDRSAIAIEEVKPSEDVFAHVSRVKGKFDQSLYQQLIGAANDFKEGDQAIGVGASRAIFRSQARLADYPILGAKRKTCACIELFQF